jgi:hypothetical protein
VGPTAVRLVVTAAERVALPVVVVLRPVLALRPA